MKTILCLLLLTIFSDSLAQTMTFDNAPEEPGFTFEGWNASSGAIWLSNLAEPATVSKNNGAWNFISFVVGPFLGENMMEVSSDLGDSYTYDTSVPDVHTLNWNGINTVTFTRISGSGASADHDNFVYSLPAPCSNPDIPGLTLTPELLCKGESVSIGIEGNLNDATSWHIYTEGCGVNEIAATTESEIELTPSSLNITYFIRGEDGNGCVDESSLECAEIAIPVFEIDNTTTLTDFTLVPMNQMPITNGSIVWMI